MSCTARLVATLVAYETLLFRGVLEVMTRVCLVREQCHQRWRSNRQVGVDLYSRAKVAVVPVVCAPRFVGDEANREILAVGDAKNLERCLSELGGDPFDDRRELVHRQG